MGIKRDHLTEIAGAIAGKPGKIATGISMDIMDAAAARRADYKQKMDRLCNKNIMGWQYTREILKHFVKRKFTYYGSEGRVSIGKIKHEIECQSLARNVILTGSAGSGKSTALKWLYVNSHVRGYSSLYLYARMFEEYESLQAVLEAISKVISQTNQCIVFFDGLDELKCIKGTDEEFQALVDFFDKKSCQDETGAPRHRFVISTRPEHFSFHKMIKRKFLKKNFDSYITYETQPLTQAEALKICKTIGKLSKFDREKHFYHFVDKWPSAKSKTGMSKAQYLRYLKKYLKVTMPEQSLLSSPLFCRYAYPIIREWSLQDYADTERTHYLESSQISYALKCYIKWEFHDTYADQKREEDDKTLLANYQRKVWAFLTEIAGMMGTDDFISKKQWEKLRKAKKLSGNISFCALQECGDGRMAFTHPLFKDYFLANYCAKMVERNARKQNLLQEEDAGQLARLLESSSSVSILYAEQLLNSNYAFVKGICDFLLQKAAHNNLIDFAKFASGQAWYVYSPEAPFTIEEYLVVFPLGVAKYHDITFSVPIFRQLRSTGVLEIECMNGCAGCDLSKISKSLTIRAVKSSPLFGTGFKHILRDFQIVHKGALTGIGGYWESSITQKELMDIVLHLELQGQISEINSSADAIQCNEAVKEALRIKKMREERQRAQEELTLHLWTASIIIFMGADNNYWCLFENDTLFVLQMTPENESWITELFSKGISENTFDYAALYGHYKTHIEPVNTIVQAGRFCRAADISIQFDADVEILESAANALNIYYAVHWKNLRLFRKREKVDKGFHGDDIDNILDISDILDLYEKAEHFLEESPNEKLTLYLSDERLFTFYIIGDGEQMVSLAQDTLELCKRYQHQKGKWLRELLLSDDMRFTGADFEKIYALAKEYIWM